jgi:hypothetical protein
MLRVALVIAFTCCGTATGIFLGNLEEKAGTKLAASRSERHVAFEYLTPDLFVTSIIREASLSGFYIFRFVIEYDPSVKNTTGISDDVILADSMAAATFNNETDKVSKTDIPDVSAYADTALAEANRVVAGKRFTQMLVQQFDLFDRTEVRKKVVEERVAPE